MPIFADAPATDPEFAEYGGAGGSSESGAESEAGRGSEPGGSSGPGGVLEWLAHPEERGQRASHAIQGESGFWLVDPLDVPGLDDRLAALGDVAGAVVCTPMHSRDAGRIAERHGVAVHVPQAFDRAADRVAARSDARVRRFDPECPGESALDHGVDARLARPMPGFAELLLLTDDATYVPELLSTAPTATVGEERLGVSLFGRPVLPRAPHADLAPQRLFFGHGRAITDGATSALEEAIANSRRRFPRALLEHGPEQVGSIVRNAILD